MTQMQDPTTRSTSRGRADAGAAGQPRADHSTKIRGLSDRQAVIAAMVANGATCQDIAFELLLPLRTVQGHLVLALRILGLSRAEELTYAVIAAHQARSLETAMTRSRGMAPIEPSRSGDDDRVSNSLVDLDASETRVPADAVSGDAASGDVADLRLELKGARAELDEQHRKMQQLREAMDSRDSIGQAKGILMERHRIGAATALRSLQDESNRTDRPLGDIARNVVLSAERDAGTQT